MFSNALKITNWIVFGVKQLFPLFRPLQPPVEVITTPYHTLSWLGPPCATRTHKNTFTRLGVDDQAETQVVYSRRQLFSDGCWQQFAVGSDPNYACLCLYAASRLERGATSSQRSSSRKSGGEAAERQSSTSGKYRSSHLAWCNGLYLSGLVFFFGGGGSYTLHSFVPFCSGEQCICEYCYARGRDCGRRFCWAS